MILEEELYFKNSTLLNALKISIKTKEKEELEKEQKEFEEKRKT